MGRFLLSFQPITNFLVFGLKRISFLEKFTRFDKNTAHMIFLARIVHLVHYFFMLFTIFGWIIPKTQALIFYLIWIPSIILQWKANDDTCILTNLENYFRNGQWKADPSEEEGGFVNSVFQNVFGITLTDRVLAYIIYGVMGLGWVLGVIHYFQLQQLQ